MLPTPRWDQEFRNICTPVLKVVHSIVRWYRRLHATSYALPVTGLVAVTDVLCLVNPAGNFRATLNANSHEVVADSADTL